MSKKNLIDAISTKYPDLTKKDIGTIVDATFNTIAVNLSTPGEKYTQSAFGTFIVKERAARTGINPKTKEKIQIKASNSIGFKPSTNLKTSVN